MPEVNPAAPTSTQAQRSIPSQLQALQAAASVRRLARTCIQVYGGRGELGRPFENAVTLALHVTVGEPSNTKNAHRYLAGVIRDDVHSMGQTNEHYVRLLNALHFLLEYENVDCVDGRYPTTPEHSRELQIVRQVAS